MIKSYKNFFLFIILLSFGANSIGSQEIAAEDRTEAAQTSAHIEVPEGQVAYVCSDGEVVFGPFSDRAVIDVLNGMEGLEGARIVRLPNQPNDPENACFTAPRMRSFLGLLRNHQLDDERLNHIEDIYELEADLVIGDFLSVNNDILRPIGTKIINTDQQIVNPHVKTILANIFINHLVPQTDGALQLDLSRPEDHAAFDVLLHFRDPLKIIALFDQETRGRIRSINLSHNQLETFNFQELMRLTPNLKNLDLSHNNLHQFHARLPVDFHLNLSHNQLQAPTLENAQQDHIVVDCSNNPLNFFAEIRLRNGLTRRSVRDKLVAATNRFMRWVGSKCGNQNVRHSVKRTALMVGTGYLYHKILYPKVISKIFNQLLSKLSPQWLKGLLITTSATSFLHNIRQIKFLNAQPSTPLVRLSLFRNIVAGLGNSLLTASLLNIPANETYHRPEQARQILTDQLTLATVYNDQLWDKFQPPLERHVIDPILGLANPVTSRIARTWNRGITATEQFIQNHQNRLII